MPQADAFDTPQGGTFYGSLLESITEAFVGNGVLADGEADVTVGSSGMDVSVSAAPTGIEFDGSTYTPGGASFTLSDGPTTTTNGADDRRADIIVFDTTAGAYDVLEGSPHPNPSPPDTPGDALLLAVVSVEHGQTTLTDDQIFAWRARPSAFPNTGDVEVPRSQLDDERTTTGIVTSDTLTSGEEVVLADTSSGAVAVTLASADVSDGNFVTIVDAGGDAATNQISVETEGAETIDGKSSDSITASYGAAVYVAFGGNWYSSGGGSSSSGGSSGGFGSVEAGGYEVVDITTLRANERLSVDKAELLLKGGDPRPDGLTLQLVYFNRYQAITQYRPVIDSPGTKGIEDGPGFTNLANFPRTVAVVVDNGQFGAGTATAKSYRASVETTVQGDHTMTMVNIRPNAPAHIANTATYNQQSGSNVGFYEVNAADETIDFDLEQVPDLQDPTIVVTTAWGSTDFDLVERDTGDTIVSESSGFDTDVWIIDVQDTSGKFRLTNFDDTQAAFYGYVRVFDAE